VVTAQRKGAWSGRRRAVSVRARADVVVERDGCGSRSSRARCLGASRGRGDQEGAERDPGEASDGGAGSWSVRARERAHAADGMLERRGRVLVWGVLCFSLSGACMGRVSGAQGS